MKQTPLFEEPAPRSDAGTLVKVSVRGGTAALSKAQKQFNKWIAKIAAQRADLAAWKDYLPLYPRRLASDIEPLQARLRAGRIALVRRLDTVLGGGQLTRPQQAKAHDMLLGLLDGLLAEGEDEELVALFNKHSHLDFEETRQAEMRMVRSQAEAIFGIDLAPDSQAGTPEDLAWEIQDQLEAAEQARAAQRASRKKSAQQLAREAARERASEDAGKSVREIYRKLASELHPDRETDALERERKTRLMQKVNEAYARKDLLALFELQLEIEQINPAGLAGIAEEKLLRYVTVLQSQSQRLEEELCGLAEPFARMLGCPASTLKPKTVEMILHDDARRLKATVRQLEADLEAFRDFKVLKNWLQHYRIASPATDDFDPEEFDQMGAPPPRRRRKT